MSKIMMILFLLNFYLSLLNMKVNYAFGTTITVGCFMMWFYYTVVEKKLH